MDMIPSGSTSVRASGTLRTHILRTATLLASGTRIEVNRLNRYLIKADQAIMPQAQTGSQSRGSYVNAKEGPGATSGGIVQDSGTDPIRIDTGIADDLITVKESNLEGLTRSNVFDIATNPQIYACPYRI